MFGTHRVGVESPNFNKMWINNGKTRKMIDKSSPLPHGFIKGYVL